MHHLLTHLRCRARDRAGVAAIEFAIIAPVLILLLGGAWDLGRAVERSIRLENAARTAAQYLTRSSTDTAGARSAAQDVLGGYGTVQPIPPMVCTCPPAGAASGGPAVDCNSNTCTTGVARYITVTVTAPADPPLLPVSNSFITSIGGAPGSVVVRLQ